MNLNLTKESKVLIRHFEKIKKKKIILAGNILDNIPLYLPTKKFSLFTTKYHIFENLYPIFKTKIKFGFYFNKEICIKSNFLIYFWPKNKKEAFFQLYIFFSLLTINTTILIIGKNSLGTRSAPKMLFTWINLTKIDMSKGCSCFIGKLKKKTKFCIKKFFNTYSHEDVKIKNLPGVFDYLGIDEGTILLASTFSKKIIGNILDLGCGSGILSILLYKNSKNINLTLVDTNIYAIYSSIYNLQIHNISATIIPSNLFSNVKQKFDYIISNPPIHNENGKLTDSIVKQMIKESINYLKINGKLYFVSNSIFCYKKILNTIFKKTKIIKKNRKYIVYKSYI